MWRKPTDPGTVTCYFDSKIALPLPTVYALTRHEKREHKRYFDKLPMLTQKLRERYEEICKASGVGENCEVNLGSIVDGDFRSR